MENQWTSFYITGNLHHENVEQNSYKTGKDLTIRHFKLTFIGVYSEEKIK